MKIKFSEEVYIPIFVWKFFDAPIAYQDLSPHGGDEDWLAFVPRIYGDTKPDWMENSNFGICDVSQHEVDNGYVYIGAHT